MSVRVRYAPSPTGNQHIGGVRTALINYLFAKSQGGTFILRLEDTDRTRYSQEYVQNLYETFRWLGFYWDEGPDVGGSKGPYVQSERIDLYRRYAEELVFMDKAYYCFCDSERLEKLRQEQVAQKKDEIGYDRHCRYIAEEERARNLAEARPYVIRLKIPLHGITVFHDALLGQIEWKNEDISPDPVLLKSDGFPTYHLANVIDDHLMGITHIMRAQEWIPSAPMHKIMYDALGWEMPELCHLPMVLGPDGHKLSKRHGATAVNEFKKAGYLPEALINYIALLGCSYEDGRDIYSLDELVRLFRIDRLNKAPAVFDYQKLEWFNGQYIRMKSDKELAELIRPYLISAGLRKEEDPQKDQMELAAIPFIKERLKLLGDSPAIMSYLYKRLDMPAAEEFVPKKASIDEAIMYLEECRSILESSNLDDLPAIEEKFRERATVIGKKLGDILMPLRVAITYSRVSPPLFESMRILGKDECIKRIEAAVAYLRGA
ncbi:MAG TPA: glutamate--tRNA ligase [Rectinema sp.]|jgi:glutamyl-tRNA synthetase|nr:glutamate--tRNA ligase [Spirochaetia bacterium]HAL93556.1 glutamate--tRNA ligase [Spirochaetaceae bacterium]HOE75535.1 glutamate--tRNA ligase [Rectinema sp.]HOM91710.1 glutamate--tRNA ligase [Rectinema sp.]HOR48873.1 glutamate--tRNA ligase [Rectinema sp.]